jgi:PhoPQ-activated pathogenicity-related protein
LRAFFRFLASRFVRAFLLAGVLLAASSRAFADPLHDYVARPDPLFACHEVSDSTAGPNRVLRYTLTSQGWHKTAWKHDLVVVVPQAAHTDTPVFLHITGSGDGTRELPFLSALALSAGVPAAVITHVPNQPLFDGRKEDDLISFSFRRYLETGDLSWPAIFPMVKSVVRGMDCLAALHRAKLGRGANGFILSGSSKRGWTTWLSGVVDKRVVAIAPKVFDMLNMKAQTELAKRSYGGQSEKIKDYTDKGLVAAIDHPRMQELRRWVDPYEYRTRLTLPKFILLGTNDPYWVVDSLSQYWDALRGPKSVFQSPNTGHSLGSPANENLISWVGLIAGKKTVPELRWSLEREIAPRIVLHPSIPPRGVTLWRSCAPTRDFRKAVWESAGVSVPSRYREIAVPLRPAAEASKYCAYLAEAEFALETGRKLSLSTEAFVFPLE